MAACVAAAHDTRDEWLRVIKAEYLEMPGLQLTKAQIRRLWGLDPPVCDALVDSLLAEHFLRKTPGQTYVLATDFGR